LKAEAATIHVNDVMSTALVTVQEQDPVTKAVSRLLNRDVGSVLVLNKQGQLAGVITKGDILRKGGYETARF
jgi:predicted transcriptional regulator